MKDDFWCVLPSSGNWRPVIKVPFGRSRLLTLWAIYLKRIVISIILFTSNARVCRQLLMSPVCLPPALHLADSRIHCTEIWVLSSVLHFISRIMFMTWPAFITAICSCVYPYLFYFLLNLIFLDIDHLLKIACTCLTILRSLHDISPPLY